MFDGKFRQSVDARMAPVGRGLVRIGFSADVVTTSGLVFAGATAWAIAAGYNWLAIVLLTLTGFHDLLDGAVAKASHRASQRGSFFDSVTDRVGDAVHHGWCRLLPHRPSPRPACPVALWHLDHDVLDLVPAFEGRESGPGRQGWPDGARRATYSARRSGWSATQYLYRCCGSCWDSPR